MSMRKLPFIVFVVVLLAVAAFIISTHETEAPILQTPMSSEELPVKEIPSKEDFIVLETPLKGANISSPLTIRGKARGQWFFEGSFPVTLVNWDGLIIAEGYATAQGEWMTTEFVPFEGTITFTAPDTSVGNKGWLILKKDNPSDDPRLDDALEVEIHY